MIKNGVKQEGVLSPTLFNMNIDLEQLCSWVPYLCHMSYTDDIILSCPSVHGLKKIKNICCDFTTNIFFLFNEK